MVNEDPDALHSGTDIIADAAWFPENLDARRNELLFVATSRSELAEQTFLDGRWDRSEARHARLDANAIIDKGTSESQSGIGIIWHTAFCCSTLLAKALDWPGSNLSLCEPQVLVDIASARRTKTLSDAQVSAVARTTLNLLSRPFSPGESVIVKPSPAANSLLRNITSQTTGQMLCLFSDCKSFLISIAKLGEDGRKYVRRLFLTLIADGHLQAQWPPAKLLEMSDLELAAIVWHMQMAEFHRNWPKFAERRIASLDCDALLESPAEVLLRTGQFFSLGIAEPKLLERAGGPLFRRNAKTGEESWDAVRRRDDHARLAQEMASNLDQIVAESYQICSSTPRDYPLPNPLVPIDKIYCPGRT